MLSRETTNTMIYKLETKEQYISYIYDKNNIFCIVCRVSHDVNARMTIFLYTLFSLSAKKAQVKNCVIYGRNSKLETKYNYEITKGYTFILFIQNIILKHYNIFLHMAYKQVCDKSSRFPSWKGFPTYR